MKVRVYQYLGLRRVLDIEDPYEGDEVDDAIWNIVCNVPHGREVFESLGIEFDHADIEILED